MSTQNTGKTYSYHFTNIHPQKSNNSGKIQEDITKTPKNKPTAINFSYKNYDQ